MCGIAGIFNVDGRPIPVGILHQMTGALSHRGPDGEGYWTRSYVGFGHRRLAIIDLSPLGHQPMQTKDGSCIITFNGEIYNFQNLRIELESKGYAFRSKTDAEVLLYAYQEWGEACIHRLNGMFAFAIWDNRQNRLFLARDRYGIKPLYYWYEKGTLVFASEIKAILKHPEVSVRVDLRALNEYFSFQNIFSDLTLFEGIRLLPAAHVATMELGVTDSLKPHQYWDFDFSEERRCASERDYVQELTRIFEQAVNSQLVSDVEIGAYLQRRLRLRFRHLHHVPQL